MCTVAHSMGRTLPRGYVFWWMIACRRCGNDRSVSDHRISAASQWWARWTLRENEESPCLQNTSNIASFPGLRKWRKYERVIPGHRAANKISTDGTFFLQAPSK